MLKRPLLAIFVLTSSLVSIEAQIKLRPSEGYWDNKQRSVPTRYAQMPGNRRLAMVGDSLFMLDSKNRIQWKWTTGGAPLTDVPVIDSRGVLYVIGYDLIWAALDSKSGKRLWSGTAAGRAVYTQIELYKDDMYFVVTDMSGYRNGERDPVRDSLTLAKGNGILWETDIPIGSEIKVERGKVFAVYKRKKRTIVQKIDVPLKLDKFIGTIDAFGFGELK